MLAFWNGGVLRCCSVKRHQVREVYYELQEKGSVSLRVFLPFSWIDSIKSMEASFFFFFSPIMHCMQNFPDQGSNTCPLQWKLRVLMAGLPGKSHIILFNVSLMILGCNFLCWWAFRSQVFRYCNKCIFCVQVYICIYTLCVYIFTCIYVSVCVSLLAFPTISFFSFPLFLFFS